MSNAPGPSGHPPATGTLEGQTQSRIQSLLALIERISRTAAVVATDTGIPALSGGLRLLSEILQKLQEMSITIEEINTLRKRLQYLNDMLDSLGPPNNPGIPNRLRTMVDKMIGKWSDVNARLDGINTKSRGARFYASKADSKKVAGLMREITESLQDLQTGVTMHNAISTQRIEETTGQTDNNLRAHAEATQSGVNRIIIQGETAQSGIDRILAQGEATHTTSDNILTEVQSVGRKVDDMASLQQENLLPRYAKRARYDAVGVRRSCLAGTRTQALDRLLTWVAVACTQREALLDVDHGNIYWVCGFAGSGKTTIAHSVAEKCEKEKRLGGSFFFSRSDAECKDPELIFTTISRQLCDFNSSYKKKVIEALQEDPSIQHSGASRQFEELIVRPLEELKEDGEVFTCAIVIDALDECDDSKATSTILTIIAQFLPRIAEFLVFIITSRPERRIAAIFEKAHRHSLSGVTKPLILHKIELDTVLHDIRLYLKEGFNDIITKYIVNKGWPSDQELNRLVVLSGGLFIWAATALLFIVDDGFADPQEQLRRLTASTPSSPDQIQSLYDEILKAVVAKGPLKARLRAILGVIATAQESLSLDALADFTGCAASDVGNALIGLRSVLHIPEDPSEPILIIHPTFPEYLLASSETKPELFHFDFADEHTASLRCCLEIMTLTNNSKKGLRRNILELEREAVVKSELSDLSRRVKDHISPSLSYACRYWSIHVSHVIEGNRPVVIDELLHSFLTQHALHWLEVCSYLNTLEGAILALDSARQTCQKPGMPCPDLCPLLTDLYRFASTYLDCINTSPVDIYHSALVHAPHDSKVKQAYGSSLRTERSLLVCRGAQPGWSRVIGTLRGGSGTSHVTFSPDGRYLAAPSYHGVGIWNLATHTLLSSITFDEVHPEGYAGFERADFSPDGTHLAVPVSPVGVAVFDVSSGRLVKALKSRCGGGFSSDGSTPAYVANGSRLFTATGGEVKLWERSDWRCVHSRHIGYEAATAISPQGTNIAYIEDSHLRLFVVSSGAYMPDRPLPHEEWEDEEAGYHASFSPDSRQIAVAKACIVRILDVEDATVIRSIRCAETESISRAPAFSPDGRRLAWNHRNWTMCVVQVDGGDEDEEHKWVFPHAGDSVAWSPDGTQLAVTSATMTESWIAIWDTSIALQRRPLCSDHSSTSPPSAQTSPLAIIYPTTTQDDRFLTLLYLPSPIFASALVDLFARQDLYTIVPCADMADAMDTALRRPQLQIRRSAQWAYIMGQSQLAREPCAAVSPNGQLIAWKHGDGVSTYNLGLADSLAKLICPGATASNFVFSPDSTLLAVAWWVSERDPGSSMVCVYRPEAGSPIYSHVLSDQLGHALAFSTDGSLVAFVSGLTIVILDWRAEVLRGLKINDSGIYDIALTADGRFLLAQQVSFGSCVIVEFDTAYAGDRRTYSLESFSPDDTGFLVRDEDGEEHTLRLWNPGERVWPVYAVGHDGWVHAWGPGRTARLCWLPANLRDVWTVSRGKFCAADREQKRAVVFDVSRIPAYIENWGSESE